MSLSAVFSLWYVVLKYVVYLLVAYDSSVLRGLGHCHFLNDATLDKIITNLIRSEGHSYGR